MTDNACHILETPWQNALAAAAEMLCIAVWELEERYAYGQCDSLALALSELTGWQMEAVVDEGSYSHVYLVTPAGRALDIWGERSREAVLDAWSDGSPEAVLLPVGRDWLTAEMQRLGIPADARDEEAKILAGFLMHAIQPPAEEQKSAFDLPITRR